MRVVIHRQPPERQLACGYSVTLRRSTPCKSNCVEAWHGTRNLEAVLAEGINLPKFEYWARNAIWLASNPRVSAYFGHDVVKVRIPEEWIADVEEHGYGATPQTTVWGEYWYLLNRSIPKEYILSFARSEKWCRGEGHGGSLM